MKDPIGAYEHGVSEESVHARTGRTRAEWFALLDEAGAAGWEHRRIAAWLGERGVDDWWSQLLTVRYARRGDT